MAENAVSRSSKSHDQHSKMDKTKNVFPKKELTLPKASSEPETNMYSELSKKYPGIFQQPSSTATFQDTLQSLKDSRTGSKISRAQSKARTKSISGNVWTDDQLEKEMSSDLQIHTYLTDRILKPRESSINGDIDILGKSCQSKEDCHPKVREVISRSPGLYNGDISNKKNRAKRWSPPKGFWKVLKSEKLDLEEGTNAFDDVSEEVAQMDAWRMNCAESPRGGNSRAPGEKCAGNHHNPSKELLRTKSLDSSILSCGEVTSEKCNLNKGIHLGGLWRTDSWESVSSNTSLISLTDRVELNRARLQRALTTCVPSSCSDHPPDESEAQENMSDFNQEPVMDQNFLQPKCISQGCGVTQSDSDWDSGISLQESDRGMRADDQSLSPRHEQAKRLLERARMKARASPLKADHSILPLVRGSLDAGGTHIYLPKKTAFSRDGLVLNLHNSGNLSDSSSCESNYGQRKKRGPSPTRVRFEDESVQDAEVRYQLRKRCSFESSIRQNSRMWKVDAPGLGPDWLPRMEYILKSDSGEMGKLCCKNTQVWGNERCKDGENPVRNEKRTGDRPQRPISDNPSFNTAVCINGKCSTCGSYIIPNANQTETCYVAPPSYEFPNVTVVSQGGKPCTPNQHKIPVETVKGIRTNLVVDAPMTRPLASRIIPRWVLPSQHRIRTEFIKETYIGEVTSIDDIVSQVDLGDTDNSTNNKPKWEGTRGSETSAYCYAVVSGSNEEPTNNVNLTTKCIEQSGKFCESYSDSIATDPVSATAICKSKSRKKDCAKTTQGNGWKIESRRHNESRNSADSKLVTSPLDSTYRSCVSNTSTDWITEVSPEHQPSSLRSTSTVTSNQCSELNREHPTAPRGSLPDQSTSPLANSHIKEMSRDMKPVSHPTETASTKSTQNHRPFTSVLQQATNSNNTHNLTVSCTSQQGPPLSLQHNLSTSQVKKISSPHYRVIHLDPQENEETQPASNEVLEGSSPVPPLQGITSCPDQQLSNGQAHILLTSTTSPHHQLQMNTLHKNANQGAESYNAPSVNKTEGLNGLLLAINHQRSIDQTVDQNSCKSCPTIKSPKTAFPSQQRAILLGSKLDASNQNNKPALPVINRAILQGFTASPIEPATHTISALTEQPAAGGNGQLMLERDKAPVLATLTTGQHLKDDSMSA
uniref:DUF4685 domain-containing protein n=1 Tax=Callorhinchus milii TaxID=7868 RepID=A0A4W3GYI3_CALMI